MLHLRPYIWADFKIEKGFSFTLVQLKTIFVLILFNICRHILKQCIQYFIFKETILDTLLTKSHEN